MEKGYDIKTANTSGFLGQTFEELILTISLDEPVETLHARKTWMPRMLRPFGIIFLLFCLLAVVGLLEAAARVLPHQGDPLVNALTNKSEAMFQEDHLFSRQVYDDSPIAIERRGNDVVEREIHSSTHSQSRPSSPHSRQTHTDVDASQSSPPSEMTPDGYIGAAPPITFTPPPAATPSGITDVSYGVPFEFSPPPKSYLASGPAITYTPAIAPPPVYSAPNSAQIAAIPAIDLAHPSPPASAYEYSSEDINVSSAHVSDAPAINPTPTAPFPSAYTLPLVHTNIDPTHTVTEPAIAEPGMTIPITALTSGLSFDPVVWGSLSNTPTATIGDPTATKSSSVSDTMITQSPTGNDGSNTSVIRATSYKETVTHTMTFYAISNHGNPWFNPGMLPPQTEGGPLSVYVYTVLFPKWAGFLGSGAFGVLLLTALHGVWFIFYSQMTLVEAFANMASPQGALAKDALFTTYTRQSLLLGLLRSIRSRSWLYFLASVAALLSVFFTSLGSEILLTDTHSCDRSPPGLDPNNPNPCPPQLMVDIPALRALQAIISAVAVIVLILGVLLQFCRTTGVLSDPSTLATVASLINHPEIVRMLRLIPPNATSQELETILKTIRFRLTSYQRVDGTWKYGIVPLTDDVQLDGYVTPLSAKCGKTSRYAWLHDSILAIILVGLLIVIVSYFKISDQGNKFNHFFNGQSFGARFILAGSGTIVADLWRDIYAEVEMMSRFTQLSGGNARAKDTVLANIYSLSAISIVQSILQRRYFTSLIAFTNVLTFVLVVALPGIPFRSGQAHIEYIVCNFVAITIISILLILLASVAVWRSRLPDWPRKPDCLASIMTYLVDSELRIHLDREIDQPNDLVATIKKSQWTFDKCAGPDAIERWTIIEEQAKSVVSTKETTSSSDLQERPDPLEAFDTA